MAEANEEQDDKSKGEGAGDDKSKGGVGAGDKDAGGDKTTFTKDEHEAAIEAALAADRQARKKSAAGKAAKSAQSAKGKKADDDSDDSEELTKERQRREQLEERLRVHEAKDSVVAAAKVAGFSNPEKIYRLVKDDLSFDDEGKPDNVKDLITIAKKDYAEELTASKGRGSADGGAGGNGAGVGASMNDYIRHAAGRR